MICSACGQQQGDAAAFDAPRFCTRCGTRLVAPSPATYAAAAEYKELQQRRRVHAHQQPLGIAWLIYGAYRLIAGVVAAVALHSFVQFGDVPPFFIQLAHTLLPVVEVLLTVTSLAALLAGYGLLARKDWARPLALVMGILALIKIPIGTGLGIYTLWVLAPQAAGRQWQAISDPAATVQ